MPASLADYRAALRTPGALAPVCASALGRFPIAMLGMASLFYVQRVYGTFGPAGLAAAGALCGEAIGAVAQGRMVDRFGPTRPVLACAALYAVASAATILTIEHHLAQPILIGVTLLLGLSMPALPSTSRALWQHLLAPGSVREAALTYEAVSLEVFFILGPGLAAALLLAPWPGTGLLVAEVSIVVGSVWFARTPVVRRLRPARRTRSLWGALASPGMRLVPLAALGFGCAAGAVEVGVPAFAVAAGKPEMAGLLLSAWAIASVLTGLAYATRPWPRPLRLRLPVLLGGFALATALMALPSGLLGLALTMLLAGSLITPQVTAQSLGVELTAPPGTATEAFGWVITAVTIGLACGQALGGALADAQGPGAAFLAGAATALALAVTLWLLRGGIKPYPHTAGPDRV
jgi:MFS family permease